MDHVKRKTDRDDALKLARLAAMNQLPTVYIPARAVREWRSLIAYRHKLVGRQTAIRNNIRSIFLREGLGLPVGHRAWTAEGYQRMAVEARALATASGEELWRGMLDLGASRAGGRRAAAEGGRGQAPHDREGRPACPASPDDPGRRSAAGGGDRGHDR